MVCLGNICRSPMAEGILRKKSVENNLSIEVDSAGTADYHVGEAPDPRAIETARKNGVDISGLRGRQFTRKDFSAFDHIYVMDRSNLRNVLLLAKANEEESKVSLILDSLGTSGMEVPDPWYGGMKDFDETFRLLNEACDKIIAEISNELLNS